MVFVLKRGPDLFGYNQQWILRTQYGLVTYFCISEPVLYILKSNIILPHQMLITTSGLIYGIHLVKIDIVKISYYCLDLYFDSNTIKLHQISSSVAYFTFIKPIPLWCSIKGL